VTAGLLAALRARLDALAERADAAPLLDGQTARQAHALVAALPPESGEADADPATLEALRVAALVHWHRHCLRSQHPEEAHGGGRSEDDDLAAAAALFSRVHRHDPLAVPDPLLPLIDTSGDPGQEDGPVTWSGMAQPYLDRYERTADPADLRTAVQLLSAALDAASEESPGRPLIVLRFAGALLSLYEDTGDERAYTVCIETARAETRLTRTADRNVAWTVLTFALLARFDRERDPAALEEAVRAARRAVSEGADRADASGDVGAALYETFSRTGDQHALSQALHFLREAVAQTPPGAPEHPIRMEELGGALLGSYERTGNPAALAEAIAYTRTALELTPEEDQDRPGRMSNLAAMLRARFLDGGAREDLHEAIDLLRTAVSLLPPAHPERAAQLSNLGNALRSHYDLTGDPSALAEAEQAARAALKPTPADHPGRPTHLGNLGTILRTRFEHGGAPDDLNEAITLLRTAVSALPHEHPSRAAQLANLGNALRLRHDHAGDQQDAVEGRRTLWAAAAPPDAPPAIRMRAAWAYADAARRDGDTTEAVKGYQLAVELLPRIAPPSLGRDDREHRLGRLAGLGSEAAAAALDTGRPELALELLEQARGILLGEVLTARGDSEELAAREPGLHAEFQRLRDALSAPEADVDTRLSDGMRFEETIALVRALPDFDRFLLPPTVDDLRPDTGGGPVVVVNVSRHRSDALVLGADPCTALRVVPLPGLTPQKVAAHVDDFLSAIEPQTSPAELRRQQSQVAQTLVWLWDAAVGPVLESLGITGPPAEGEPWPRVWWCPVGPLACLPLHAAGRHEVNGDSALDRVVASYTPTVQALAATRRRTRHEPPHLAGRPGRALVVAMPDTPGAPRLPHAYQEAESVALMVPQTTLLAGAEAHRTAVLAELGRHPIAHFACHGVTDWRDTSASRLLLADGALSVRDLLRHRLDETRLVVLSACSTSAAGGGPSDEAVHLASSFLAAGAAHVVGTLWAIEDKVAVRTAATLYKNLTADGTLPPNTGLTAFALHAATRRLREQYPGRPGLWAPFVHVGM
jgi:tetratricopeptide (TPR) repeat protein